MEFVASSSSLWCTCSCQHAPSPSMVAVTSFTEDGESQGGSEESSVGTQGALPYQWLQGQVAWEGALPIHYRSLLAAFSPARNSSQTGHIKCPIYQYSLYLLYIGSASKHRAFGLSQPSGYRDRVGWGPLFPVSEICLLCICLLRVNSFASTLMSMATSWVPTLRPVSLWLTE